MPLESSLLLKLGRSDCIWLCVFADGFLHQYHTAKNESPLCALTAKHTRELWLKVRIRWKEGQWITLVAHFLWQSWVDFQLARVFDLAWEIWKLFLLGMLGISFISFLSIFTSFAYWNVKHICSGFKLRHYVQALYLITSTTDKLLECALVAEHGLSTSEIPHSAPRMSVHACAHRAMCSHVPHNGVSNSLRLYHLVMSYKPSWWYSNYIVIELTNHAFLKIFLYH